MNIGSIKNVTIILLIMLLLASGCGRGGHDPRLERIRTMVSGSPREAMAALDSISPSSLSAKDQPFYNLLRIKAQDKSFILHRNDSLVKTVIEYYSRHQDNELYPEALYYGGRVYFDLGDYPTSLRYFQDALDLLPESTSNLTLRGNVLAQMSDMLVRMGLFSQSIPYFKEAISNDSVLADTVNIAYDNLYLARAYMNMDNYDLAETHLNKSMALKGHMTEDFEDEVNLYRAAVKYEKERPDSALIFIRSIIKDNNQEFRALMLSYASKIYLAVNIPDSALFFAHQLVADTSLDNRKIGYKVLLSDHLRDYIPRDSLLHYVTEYKRATEEHFFNRESNEALLQNSLYNYKIHERERNRAERRSNALLKYLLWAIFILLIGSVVFFAMRLRSKNRIIKLQSIIGDLMKQREQLSASDKAVLPLQISDSGNRITENAVRKELREQLLKYSQSEQKPFPVSPVILKSMVYGRLREIVESDKPLIDSEKQIWKELERVVLESSPEFKSKLQLLSEGNLSVIDVRLAMLMKCGFTPVQIAAIVGRHRSTVSNQRNALKKKILGEEGMEYDLEVALHLI